MLELRDCRRLDDEDVLAPVRSRFVLPEGIVYLDGNSLGALPAAVADRMRRVVEDEWGLGLIASWNDASWIELPRRVGDRLGRLVGAEAGSVVAADSTSVNLHKAVVAAVESRPGRDVVITDRGNFPTDVYVIDGITRRHGKELRLVAPDAVVDAIGDTTAAVALTQVDYRTGRLHDMAAITAAAHHHGAMMVWDLAHSAGVMPIDLAGCEVDLAVGCGYKYLNGGPGAPAFLYVAPRHQPAFDNAITGWFGHERPFDFELEWAPAVGIDRALVGTPHVLSLAALDEALAAFDGVDLADVRAKSLSLTGLFIRLVDERLAGLGLEMVTPRRPDERGSQVSLRHPAGFPVARALIEAGVVGDFRAPDIIRFGFAPLYVSHVDVWRAVEVLADIMRSGRWADPRFAVRSAVT